MKINTAKFTIATIAIAIISFFGVAESNAQETPLGLNGHLTTVNVSCSCKAMAYKITYVQPGSPAHRAGVNSGDVIFKANGVRVDSYSMLALMRSMLGQGSVSLHCFRGGVYHSPVYYGLTRNTPTVHHTNK